MMAAAGASASGRRYIDPATIGVATAALLVLQTRVKLKRDRGKWTVEIEKKALADGKALAERLLSYLPK